MTRSRNSAQTLKDPTARVLRDPRAGSGVRLASVNDNPDTLGKQLRDGILATYERHLESGTSKAGDTYSRRTAESYLEAAALFGRYLDGIGFTGDFTEVTVDEVNGWLTAYRKTHTVGGANTKERRLKTFYFWVEREYEATSPFRSGRVVHYRPSAPPPSTLGEGVVEDILATCAGKAYEDVRDAALLQLLLTGVRRAELAQLWVEDIDLGNRLARVGAFKSARVNAAVVRVVDGQEHHAGRYVPLTPEAVLAVTRWLKVRAGHKLVERGDSGPMWYGTRGRSKLTGNGILRMVKRRAEEAGYNPAQINVHAFRHTWADRMLDSGKLHEGEVMALGGWKDRSMLDRYASNRANARAIDAARRVGLA